MSPSSRAFDAERIDADVLATILAEELPDDDGPGAALAVYRDGVLTAHATRGSASLEYGVPISAHTVFDIASVSKQMTAACAVSLAHDGLVDLDADLRDLLPELRHPGITLRRCLHHLSGLRDYMTVTAIRGLSLGEMKGERDFLDWLTRTDGVDFAPGTAGSYSNTGYVATAIAVARATGTRFGDLMNERVFAPLSMHSSTLHDIVGKVVPGMAFSYFPHDAGYLREEMAEEQVGDGAVLTTVHDLAAWMGFLTDGRGLGEAIRSELVTPGVLADGRTTGYGLGLDLGTIDGSPVLSHSGGMYSYSAHVLCVPETGSGVAVLGNRPLAARSLAERVLDAARPSAPTSPATGELPARALPGERWIALRDGAEVVVTTRADGTGRLSRSRVPGRDVELRHTADRGWIGEDLRLAIDGGRLVVTEDLVPDDVCLPLEHSPAAPAELPRGRFESTDLGVGTLVALDGGVALTIGSLHSPLHFRGTTTDESAGRSIEWFTTVAEPAGTQSTYETAAAPENQLGAAFGEVTIGHELDTERVTVHLYDCTFGPFEPH